MDSDGLVLSSWGRQGVRKRQFNMPRVVARDHFGNIWVLDSGNSRVSNFNETGKFNFTWGSFGTQNGLLNIPLGMALNNIDQGILADTGNFRIQVFNDMGPAYFDQSPVTTDSGAVTEAPIPVNNTPVTVEGWYGDGPFQFKEPAGVSMTKNGSFAVADGLTGRVEIFNGRFDFIGQWKACDENLGLAFPPPISGSGLRFQEPSLYHRHPEQLHHPAEVDQVGPTSDLKWGRDAGADRNTFHDPHTDS